MPASHDQGQVPQTWMHSSPTFDFLRWPLHVCLDHPDFTCNTEAGYIHISKRRRRLVADISIAIAINATISSVY